MEEINKALQTLSNYCNGFEKCDIYCDFYDWEHDECKLYQAIPGEYEKFVGDIDGK